MEDITQNPALNEFLQKYDKQDWNEVILKLCLISLGYLNANNPKPLYSFDELDEVLLNFQNQNNQIPSPNEITPPNQMGNSRINMPSQMVNNQNIPSQNENEQPYNISFQRNNQNPLGESNNSNINMRGINNSDINTSTPNNNKVLNPFDNIDNSNINNNIKNYNIQYNPINPSNNNYPDIKYSYYNDTDSNKYQKPQFSYINSSNASIIQKEIHLKFNFDGNGYTLFINDINKAFIDIIKMLKNQIPYLNMDKCIFLCNDKTININKTIKENHLRDGDIIAIVKFDEDE